MGDISDKVKGACRKVAMAVTLMAAYAMLGCTSPDKKQEDPVLYKNESRINALGYEKDSEYTGIVLWERKF